MFKTRDGEKKYNGTTQTIETFSFRLSATNDEKVGTVICGCQKRGSFRQQCFLRFPFFIDKCVFCMFLDKLQRKMEKSKSGIFSVSLKLYPGRYEVG